MQDVLGNCEPTAMPSAKSQVYTAETDSIWSHCLHRQREYYLGADTRGKPSYFLTLSLPFWLYV